VQHCPYPALARKCADPSGDLLPFRRMIFGDTDFLRCDGRPPTRGSIPSRSSLTPRTGMHCHLSDQFARSPLGEEPNLGGFVLQFGVTRLLGIYPDGLRLSVKLLRLIHAMSDGQGLCWRRPGRRCSVQLLFGCCPPLFLLLAPHIDQAVGAPNPSFCFLPA
jgi:hypothetical protein